MILRLVDGYAPVWLAAILGACVMAAVMASDSQILALSTMFTEDVFAFYGGKARFGQAVQVTTGRIFVVLITIVAYAIAMRMPQSIFDIATQYAFAGYSALSPLLVAAIFWKGSTKWGALASTLWTAAAVVGGGRHPAVDPGAAARQRRARVVRVRRRHHHPRPAGRAGARLPAGRADDDRLGAADVDGLADDGARQAERRDDGAVLLSGVVHASRFSLLSSCSGSVRGSRFDVRGSEFADCVRTTANSELRTPNRNSEPNLNTEPRTVNVKCVQVLLRQRLALRLRQPAADDESHQVHEQADQRRGG